ncbi:hypothetical protein P691DRAFT_564103 [Macrolepiota fuliginosa MF-IS2]|uniref:DH domain-containing protein n=1 Tax=Macrolepiota fuliginosa MF-IS2 TaxID=1400762 RepID=A0A9P6CA88_9AGAR|nr:hypothetical protein P691DRAFT_564103 [Macrolepiota fuliginosa MF-IS2]
MGTEALISLAWTGEISSPIVVSGYVPSRIGDTYMWPKLKISDTTVRRGSWAGIDSGEGGSGEGGSNGDKQQEPGSWFYPGHSSSHCPRPRRWTLASAISDDQITDESLVEFLEELRLHRLRSNERSVSRFLLHDPSSPSDEAPTCRLPGGTDISLQPNNGISDDVSKAWSTARRTLLVCRELIRTERHYLLALNVLAKSETQSPPPPLMLSRLPALIHASTLFLDRMEKNPSVLGVCDAFIQAYEQLEEAFVQWCGVVGGFFTADSPGDPSAVKRSNSAPMGSSPTNRDGPMTLKKRVGSWGRMMHSRRINADGMASTVPRNPKNKSRSRLSVRDLAILPTQRITRYVLLFKDLLIHSPSISIRTTIEDATELSMSLARQADRAQDHASFRMD